MQGKRKLRGVVVNIQLTELNRGISGKVREKGIHFDDKEHCQVDFKYKLDLSRLKNKWKRKTKSQY